MAANKPKPLATRFRRGEKERLRRVELAILRLRQRRVRDKKKNGGRN